LAPTSGPTAFAPFPGNTAISATPNRRNLSRDGQLPRRHLEAILAQLRSAGIEVTLDPETYPNGRFARLHDPEGNPIELWQPAGRDT